MSTQDQIRNVQNKLNLFGKKIAGRATMEALALIVKDNIFVRTNSGVDSNKRKFDPYSPKYKYREGKTTVNLTRTGKMLKSMTQKSLSDTQAVIYFSDSESRKLADIHTNKGAGKSKVVRPFFGINDDDQSQVFKKYQEVVSSVKREVGI